jgi:hypothetical protein
MPKTILFAAILLAALGACAKKQEISYVEQPVTAEPVFAGKYQ